MNKVPLSWRERIGVTIAVLGFACFAVSGLFLGPRSDPNWPAFIPMAAGGLVTVVGIAVVGGGRGVEAERTARATDEMPPNDGAAP